MIRDESTLNVIVGTVAQFVKERLIPIEMEVSENNHIPAEIIAEISDLGLFGLTIPEEYGGLDLTIEEETRVYIELCYTSPVFRSLISSNVGPGAKVIVNNGTSSQKERYLPLIASGEKILAYALNEHGIGSNPGNMKTTACRVGDNYVINGTKSFVTNAPNAGLVMVFARTDAEACGTSGISTFLIETGTPGMNIGKPEKKMGNWGSHVSDVIFTDCRVPASALIGGLEGVGFETAMACRNRSSIIIAAAAVAASNRIIDDTVRYSLERKQFGQAIAEFQMIQSLLAYSKTESYAAKCMTLDAANKFDDGNDTNMVAASCKYFATEMVGTVVDRAVQIFGGYGYIRESSVERFYRDVRLLRLCDGTSQTQKQLVVQSMFAA